MKLILILGLIACALAYPDRSGRIVGGQDVAQGQIPSQASLRSWGSTSHFAGGVLISNRWVITAAVHMVGRAHDSLNIAVGIIALSATFTEHQSLTIVIHHSYNPTTRENNIALVQSAIAFNYTQYIQPVPILSQFIPDWIGQVSGWGATDPNQGPNSEILQMLTVISVPCTTTSSYFPSIFCADTLLGSSGGICTSDIGGPLLVSGGLIGIASWHPTPCASQPDEYLRISTVRTWIGSVTGV